MQAQLDVQRDIERYQADAGYLEAHRGELVEQYPEQWVAVYNQVVVGIAKDMERLVVELERKGIRPGRAYCQYLTDKEDNLILLGVS